MEIILNIDLVKGYPRAYSEFINTRVFELYTVLRDEAFD
jgi:hypothetical protein